MKSTEQWFSLYAETHTQPINKALHNVCVPLILFSAIALLSHAQITARVNFGTLFVVGSLLFYALLGVKEFFLMLAAIVPMYFFVISWGVANKVLLYAGIFAAGWVGQFIGHHIEGKKPSFFQDLQFLLIGPLWVFAGLFRVRLLPRQGK